MGSVQGRRRAQHESKRATTIRAVVFFALVAGVVFVSKPLWHGNSSNPGTSFASGTPSPTAPSPLLSVRFRSGAATSASTAASQPWLQIVNVSSRDIDLGTVTLRYYFTQEGGRSYAANCILAEVGCSNISEQIVALPGTAAGADHYVQVTFSALAGTLKPQGNSGAIELELYVPGGAAMDQSNDASFAGAQTAAYRQDAHVTAFVGSALAWGQEPNGSKEPSPDGTAVPAPAAGVLFDDFHYAGSGDSALNKHGWVVRTSSGGPGILGTWKASGVSFPTLAGAQGDETLDLRATTDGTKSGTTQAEIDSESIPFFTGTYAARVHFNDAPTAGTNGDPINEDFYMISPRNNDYSEMDAEYEPNGGWGAPGPRLDTTTWYSVYNCNNVVSATSVVGCDRDTRVNKASLSGWHTLMITAAGGVVTYSIDGHVLFTTSGKYYPRESMSADFNAWFVDLKQPISGKRQWDMQVNWFYYNAHQTLNLNQVQKTVGSFYANGTNFVDTISKQ